MQIPSDIKTPYRTLPTPHMRNSVAISNDDLIRLDRVAQANEATRRALADELGNDEDASGKLSSTTMAQNVLERLRRVKGELAASKRGRQALAERYTESTIARDAAHQALTNAGIASGSSVTERIGFAINALTASVWREAELAADLAREKRLRNHEGSGCDWFRVVANADDILDRAGVQKKDGLSGRIAWLLELREKDQAELAELRNIHEALDRAGCPIGAAGGVTHAMRIKTMGDELKEWRSGARQVSHQGGIRIETVSKSSGTATFGEATSARLDGKPDVKCKCCGLIHGDEVCRECGAGTCKWHSPDSVPLADLNRAWSAIAGKWHEFTDFDEATEMKSEDWAALVGRGNIVKKAAHYERIRPGLSKLFETAARLKLVEKPEQPGAPHWTERLAGRLHDHFVVTEAAVSEVNDLRQRAQKAEATLKIERAHDTRPIVELLGAARQSISTALELTKRACKSCGRRFVALNPEGNCGACSPPF